MTRLESQWRASVNGASARPWFVQRPTDNPGAPMEVAEDAQGYYRRFASRDAAQRAADQLNAINAKASDEGRLFRFTS